MTGTTAGMSQPVGIDEERLMTEEQWRACTDPERMLAFLRGRISDRKRRLFAVACCRRIESLFVKDWMAEAVATAELHADGSATDKELERYSIRAQKGYFETDDDFKEVVYGAIWSATDHDHEDEVEGDDFAANTAEHAVFTADDAHGERSAQCDLIRDVVGPLPFLEVRPQPSWLAWNDGLITKMAQTMYTDRSFDRLPILADALEESGCSDEAILSHLRGPGPHVRGCWVVDLLLGKNGIRRSPWVLSR
jgi:hypothetical protein